MELVPVCSCNLVSFSLVLRRRFRFAKSEPAPSGMTCSFDQIQRTYTLERMRCILENNNTLLLSIIAIASIHNV
jgi:hypothetical protein